MKRIVIALLAAAFLAPSFFVLTAYRDLLQNRQRDLGNTEISGPEGPESAEKVDPTAFQTQGGSPQSARAGEHYQMRQADPMTYQAGGNPIPYGKPEIKINGDRLEIILNTDQNGIIVFTLFDVTGEKVLCNREMARAGSNKFELDLQYAAPGLYFLETDHGTERNVDKFVVSPPTV